MHIQHIQLWNVEAVRGVRHFLLLLELLNVFRKNEKKHGYFAFRIGYVCLEKVIATFIYIYAFKYKTPTSSSII